MLDQLIARMSLPAAATQTWGNAGLPIGRSDKVEGLRHRFLQMTDAEGGPKPRLAGSPTPRRLPPFRRVRRPLPGVPLWFSGGATLQLVHRSA